MMIIETSLSRLKASFFNFFSSILRIENKKPTFPDSSGLKSVCEKLGLRDGLVRTEGPATSEIRLRVQSPLVVWTGST